MTPEQRAWAMWARLGQADVDPVRVLVNALAVYDAVATDPQPARITLLDFIGHEGARILTFFSYAGDDAAIGPDLDTLAQLVAQGRLHPTISIAVDWKDVGRLLDAMREGKLAGKTVLTVTSP